MKKPFSLLVLFCFLANTLMPQGAWAQLASPSGGEIALPRPGEMVPLSPAFTPAYLKGLSINPRDPFKFDFIINRGEAFLNPVQKHEEYTTLIKYFLAALAVADDNQWVNLSPYEKGSIVPQTFGLTQMGRDLLAEDYMLKQITASLIYPQGEIGRKFWRQVYEEAAQKFGSTNVPVNTFNKVWIIPEKAVVYEKGNTAYVMESHLKVMLEEDYLALQKHECRGGPCVRPQEMVKEYYNRADTRSAPTVNALGSQIIHAIVLPALEKEVNEGRNFAVLRQVYSGMLLATWYKRRLKETILGKLYADKGKVKGIERPNVITGSDLSPEQIYAQYLQAYKKGVFNMIKDDTDRYTGQVIPRKYFSGGVQGFATVPIASIKTPDSAQMVQIDQAMSTSDVVTTRMQRPGPDAAMLSESDKRAIDVFREHIKDMPAAEAVEYLQAQRNALHGFAAQSKAGVIEWMDQEIIKLGKKVEDGKGQAGTPSPEPAVKVKKRSKDEIKAAAAARSEVKVKELTRRRPEEWTQLGRFRDMESPDHRWELRRTTLDDVRLVSLRPSRNILIFDDFINFDVLDYVSCGFSADSRWLYIMDWRGRAHVWHLDNLYRWEKVDFGSGNQRRTIGNIGILIRNQEVHVSIKIKGKWKDKARLVHLANVKAAEINKDGIVTIDINGGLQIWPMSEVLSKDDITDAAMHSGLSESDKRAIDVFKERIKDMPAAEAVEFLQAQRNALLGFGAKNKAGVIEWIDGGIRLLTLAVDNKTQAAVQGAKDKQGGLAGIKAQIKDIERQLNQARKSGGTAPRKILPQDQIKVEATLEHDGAVFSAHLVDGRILTASEDGTAKIWKLNTQGKWEVEVTLEHRDWVRSAQMLTDGRILTASDNKTAKIWKLNTQGKWEVEATLEHDGWVRSAQMLADGRILTASEDKTAKIWKLNKQGKWKVETTLQHDGAVFSAQMLADGRILTASEDKTAKIWKLNKQGKWKVETTLQHDGAVRSAQMLADGRILTGSEDKTAKIWKRNTQREWEVEKILKHDGTVYSAQMLADGRILTAGEDNTAKVWKLNKQEKWEVEATLKHDGVVFLAQMLPDGRILTGDDIQARIWQVFKPQANVAASAQIIALEAKLKELMAQVKGAANIVRELKVKELTRSPEKWTGLKRVGTISSLDSRWVIGASLLVRDHVELFKAGPTDIAIIFDQRFSFENARGGFSADGKWLYLSDRNNHIHVWYLNSADAWEEVSFELTISRWRNIRVSAVSSAYVFVEINGVWREKTILKHPSEVLGSAINENGIVTIDGKGNLRIWPMSEVLSKDDITDAAMHSVISESDKRAIDVFKAHIKDMPAAEAVEFLKGQRNALLGFAAKSKAGVIEWLDGGIRLLTLAVDNKTQAAVQGAKDKKGGLAGIKAQIKDIERQLNQARQSGGTAPREILPQDQIKVEAILEHHGRVYSAQTLADGRILTASDNTVKIWKLNTQGKWAVEATLEHDVYSAQMLADGRILMASNDTAKIWKLNTQGKWEVEAILEHKNRVRSAQMLADGRILTASDDGTAKIWKFNTQGEWEVEATLEHDGWVNSAQMLADGRILTASDNTAKIWKLNTQGKWEVEATLENKNWVGSAQMLADGRILMASNDKTAKIWKLNIQGKWEVEATLGHDRWVKSAQMLADGRILTASNDKTAKIWKLNIQGKWAVEATLEHDSAVLLTQMLADGRILTASDDGKARIWQVFKPQANVAASAQIIALEAKLKELMAQVKGAANIVRELKVKELTRSPEKWTSVERFKTIESLDHRWMIRRTTMGDVRLSTPDTGFFPKHVLIFDDFISFGVLDYVSCGFSADSRWLYIMDWQGSAQVWHLDDADKWKKIDFGSENQRRKTIGNIGILVRNQEVYVSVKTKGKWKDKVRLVHLANVDAAKINKDGIVTIDENGGLTIWPMSEVLSKDDLADAAMTVSKDYERALFKDNLRDYFLLKQKMVAALDKEDEEGFRAAYAEALKVVVPLSRQAREAGMEQTVLSADEAVAEGGIDPVFVVGHLDRKKGMAGLTENFMALYNEIRFLGTRQFSTAAKVLLDQAIDYYVNGFFDSPAEQEKWRQKLQADVFPYYLGDVIGPLMSKGRFQEWRGPVRDLILQTNHLIGKTGGFFYPATKKLYVADTADDLDTYISLVHEMWHYLADQGAIKLPFEWEDISHASEYLALEQRLEGQPEVFAQKLKETGLSEGEPLVVELFQYGQQMGESGRTGFMVKPGISDRKAGYFSIEYLLAEVRRIYEEHGGPLDNLTDAKAPGRATYAAQRAVGIIMAGVLSGMHQRNAELKPLRLLKDFFEVLYERYAPPLENDAYLQQYMADTHKIVESFAGQKVRFVPSHGGLWYFESDAHTDTMHYVPSDFYPRFYDGKDEGDMDGKLEAARERALGLAFLAVSQVKFGLRGLIKQLPADMQKHPALNPMWNTLLLPKAARFGLEMNLRNISSGVLNSTFDGAPRWVMRVFRDRYDFGDSDGHHLVADALFSTMPLHLQYLDSLLYRRFHYDPDKKTIADPRVKDLVLEEAVMRTMGSFDEEKDYGWLQLLFHPDKLSDHQIEEIISNRIWPVYLELFERAKKHEELWRAYQRKMKEEQREASRQDFEKMAQQMMDDLEQYWNSLPQEAREAIEEAVQQELEEAQQQFGQSSGQQQGSSKGQGNQGQGKPGGKSGGQGTANPSGKPGTKGTGTPGGGIENVEQAIDELGKDLDGLSAQMDKISGGFEDVKTQAGGMNASGIEGQQLDKQREAAGDLQEKAGAFQDAVQELQNRGRQAAEASDNQRASTQAVKDGLPSPEEGRKADTSSADLQGKIQALQDKLDGLQEKANGLKRGTDGLADKLDDPMPDGEQVAGQIRQIEGAANEARDRVGQTQGANVLAADQLEDLKNEIAALKQRLAESPSANAKSEAQGQSQPGQGKGGPSQPAQQPATENKTTAPSRPNPSAPIDIPDAVTMGEFLKPQPRPSQPKIESAKPKPFDLKRAQQEEEEMIKQRTGLDPKEWKEYQSWLNFKITYKGKIFTIGKLSDKFKRALDVLTLPAVDIGLEKGLEHGPVLTDVVAAITGGPAYGRYRPTEPLGVKLSFLIDKSGSMGMDNQRGMLPIQMARVIYFVMVKALFEHNVERKKRGYQPIEFEVGIFEDDPKDGDTMISHKTSRNAGFRKERVLYDVWKALQPGAGTHYASSLHKYTSRLLASPEANSSGEKSVRILFALTDEDVNEQQRADVLATIRQAEQQGAHIFIIPLGNAQQVATTKSVYADKPKRVIAPDSFAELPRATMESFANSIEAPAMGRSWLDGLDAAMIAQAPKPAVGPLKPIAGYKNFYARTIDGYDFLVFKRNGMERYWQRGLGGPYVPKTIVPEIAPNEDKIVTLLDILYRPESIDRSYSADKLFGLSQVEDGKIQLLERTSDSEYSQQEIFDLHTSLFSMKQDEEGTIYQNGKGQQWRTNTGTNTVLIKQNNNWNVVEGFIAADAGKWAFYLNAQGYLTAFCRDNNEVVLFYPSASGAWIKKYDLQFDRQSAAESWDGKYAELIGETGLGKDEIMMAAARLINEEVYVLVGNSDLDVEDIESGKVSVGAGEAGTSGAEPSNLNKIMRKGGWFVIREAHKLRPGVLNSLKSHITARDHKWPVLRDGVERFETLPNNPFARLLTSVNRIRAGITGSSTESNAPMQDRKELLEFYWMKPEYETEMQVQYALDLVRQLGRHKDDWNKFEDGVRTYTAELVRISDELRLSFAGYKARQQAAIFADWDLLDSKELAKRMAEDNDIYNLFKEGPAHAIADQVKRPPSPRVIKNIIRHFITYEKDYKYRPLSVIRSYYNFYAEEDPNNTYEGAIRKFSGWRSDTPGIPSVPVHLNARSFKVVGDNLMITPSGNSADNWDTVTVPLNPKAEIRSGHLPVEVVQWIESSKNTAKFYQYLQGHALHMDAIFVGKPGVGKTTMTEAIQKLLNGPGIFKVEINEEMRADMLTYSRGLKNFRTRFFPQILPDSMNDGTGHGNILNMSESSQGRPSMLSVLNEKAERGVLPDPNSPSQFIEAQEGHGIIHDINRPGSAARVKSFPDDFIERHMVINFEDIPPQEMAHYLNAVAAGRSLLDPGAKFRLNPRIIGEPLLDDGGKPEEFPDGEIKYGGTIGVWQNIIREQIKDPEFFPRDKELSIRNLRTVVKALVDQYAFRAASGKRDQDILLDIFLQTLTLEGEPKDLVRWRYNIVNVFKTMKLWGPDKSKDALDEFLKGEGVFVQDLKVIREPKTGNEEINRILRYLQTNTLGQVDRQIERLQELVTRPLMNETWVISKQDDDKKTPEQKLKTVKDQLKALDIAREVYQVTQVILDERCDPLKPPAYSEDNRAALKNLRGVIWNYIVNVRQWPEILLEAPADRLSLTPEQEKHIPVFPLELREDIIREHFFPPSDAAMTAADERAIAHYEKEIEQDVREKAFGKAMAFLNGQLGALEGFDANKNRVVISWIKGRMAGLQEEMTRQQTAVPPALEAGAESTKLKTGIAKAETAAGRSDLSVVPGDIEAWQDVPADSEWRSDAYKVKFSWDGKSAFTLKQGDTFAVVWKKEGKDWKEIHKFEDNRPGALTGLIVSQDGRRVIVLHESGLNKAWLKESVGQQKWSSDFYLQSGYAKGFDGEFSKDGRRLLMNANNKITIYDQNNPEGETIATDIENPVGHFSGDGNRVVYTQDPTTLKVLQKENAVWVPVGKVVNVVNGATFGISTDGKGIWVFEEENRFLYVWEESVSNVFSVAAIGPFLHKPADVVFSHNGDRLIAAVGDSIYLTKDTVLKWTGGFIWSNGGDFTRLLDSVAFGMDNENSIIAVEKDHTIHVLVPGVKDGKEEWQEKQNVLEHAQVLKMGDLVAPDSPDKHWRIGNSWLSLYIWDGLATKLELGRANDFWSASEGRGFSGGFSKDSKWLMLKDREGKAHVWHLDDNDGTWRIIKFYGSLLVSGEDGIRFERAGHYLHITKMGKMGNVIVIKRQHDARIESIGFSHDMKFVVTVDSNKKAWIWPMSDIHAEIAVADAAMTAADERAIAHYEKTIEQDVREKEFGKAMAFLNGQLEALEGFNTGNKRGVIGWIKERMAGLQEEMARQQAAAPSIAAAEIAKTKAMPESTGRLDLSVVPGNIAAWQDVPAEWRSDAYKVKFSANGKLAFTLKKGDTFAVVWKKVGKDWKEIHKLEDNRPGALTGLIVSQDGGRVIVLHASGLNKAWRKESVGQEWGHDFGIDGDFIKGFDGEFSKDGRRLLMNAKKRIIIYDQNNPAGEEISASIENPVGHFSADGKRVVCSRGSNHFRVLEKVSTEWILAGMVANVVDEAAFGLSADGKSMWVIDKNKHLYILENDMADDFWTGEDLGLFRYKPTDAVFSHNGNRLIMAIGDIVFLAQRGTDRRWKRGEGVWNGEDLISNPLGSVAFGTDETSIVAVESGSQYKVHVLVLVVKDGKEEWRERAVSHVLYRQGIQLDGLPGPASGMSFSGDGRRAVTWENKRDGQMVLWQRDGASWKEIAREESGAGWRGAFLSYDGKRMLMYGGDSSYPMEEKNGELEQLSVVISSSTSLGIIKTKVFAMQKPIAISPNGKSAIVMKDKTTAELWGELYDGFHKESTWRDLKEDLPFVFHPDGSFFVIKKDGSEEALVVDSNGDWTLAQGQSAPSNIVYSNDRAHYVVFGQEDNKLNINWPGNHNKWTKLDSNGMESMAFSPDNRYLIVVNKSSRHGIKIYGGHENWDLVATEEGQAELGGAGQYILGGQWMVHVNSNGQLNILEAQGILSGGQKSNAAMSTVRMPGGIDMNPASLDMQIKRDGNGVPLPLEQQELENIKIDGLVPVILDIRPASSTPLFAQLTGINA